MALTSYTAGMTTNLFAAPGGSAPTDGWVIELPGSWTLDGATVLRYGSERVPAEVRTLEAPNVYAVVIEERQQGPHEIIVRATVGAPNERVTWSLAPFTYDPMGYRAVRDGERITRDVMVAAPAGRATGAPTNRALRIGAEPVVVRPEAVPALAAATDFTVEFWLQTTGLNEVVLSTWTGDEKDAYPLEIMIDASGRLRYYFGQQGRHASLTTRAPLADGRWHHVAVTYHADTQRLVLLREGQPVDSLRNAVLPAVPLQGVALGGRRLARSAVDQADTSRSLRFSGQIDEIRLWPTVRSPGGIRDAARRPLPDASTTDVVQLRFDDPPPPELIARWPQGARREASTLSLTVPLHDLQAVVDEGRVHLEWASDDPRTAAFIIERSVGGAPFETVGRVRPHPSTPGGGRHEFSDAPVDGQVVYYRIRQQFEGGAERISGTLKIGLGAPDEQAAALIGNFPNPFSEVTTIAYEVHATQQVQLTVWDLSGQRVTTLVDDRHTPGYYEQAFRADNLPSGTYFVRLRTPQTMSSHRMVLLK